MFTSVAAWPPALARTSPCLVSHGWWCRCNTATGSPAPGWLTGPDPWPGLRGLCSSKYSKLSNQRWVEMFNSPCCHCTCSSCNQWSFYHSSCTDYRSSLCHLSSHGVWLAEEIININNYTNYNESGVNYQFDIIPFSTQSALCCGCCPHHPLGCRWSRQSPPHPPRTLQSQWLFHQ